MLTVAYDELLKGIMSLWGGKAELPGTEIYGAIRGALDLALAQAWESEWWPELMEGEHRRFRALWNSTTTYVAGDEVYEPWSDAYYQALAGNTNVPVGTWADGVFTVNEYIWHISQSTYSGEEWEQLTTYQAGDVVYYPTTERYYAARMETTIAPPTDTDYWGLLTAFDRYVPWDLTGANAIGDVFDVKTNNPEVTVQFEGLTWGLSSNGVQVREAVTGCWVEYRRRRPQLIGDVFDATVDYAIGEQVWYTPANGQGNLYDCIQATTTGQLPTDTAYWTVVEIPRAFKGYLVWEAYAWLLKPEDQAHQRAVALAMAEKYLLLETDKLYRQSAQTAPPSIKTY